MTEFFNTIQEFISNNMVEVIGTLLGLLYLYLEIKANKWLWPIGLLTSAMYIYVFFNAKFYADMALQFYYVFISIYGWILWQKGTNKTDEAPIVRLKKSLALNLLLATAGIYVVIAFVLKNYTDSPIPYWDAFTTALSIIATWMLARKILEQWLVWVLVNAISLGLYVYKGLYPTVVLFFFYTVLAVVGYIQWKKTFKTEQSLIKK